MRLGFDAKRLFQNKTGLGNYSRSLVRNLQAFYSENEYTLFAPKRVENEKTAAFLNAPFTCITPQHALPAYWRTVSCTTEIQSQHIDIFHGLSHELPLGIRKTGAQAVVTVHDLIFKRYPEQYSLWDRTTHDLKCQYACRVADKIVAISESTKYDLMEFYRIPEKKISVVYQSCEFINIEIEKENNDGVKKTNKNGEYTILYVGSIIERKNLLNLVKAIELLPASLEGARLYVVGGGKNAYRAEIETYIETKKLSKKVIFLKNIADSDLATWYQKADIFVYPSLYEGFGIPIIEALFSKTPVLTSTQRALTEAAGENSLCLDVSKPTIIAEGIATILQNRSLAEKMAHEGLLYAQRFLPETVSRELMTIYKNL